MATIATPTTVKTKRYKLVTGKHLTSGIVYDALDPDNNVLELTTKQAKKFGDRVELVASEVKKEKADEDEA